MQGRISKKMALASNGSGSNTVEYGGSGNIGDIVDSSCKKFIKKIVKKINENMGVLYAQQYGLCKDMELLQKTMELLTTYVMNLIHKVENIEVNVETTTMGVLKEAFGFGDESSLQVDGVVGDEIHGWTLGQAETKNQGYLLTRL